MSEIREKVINILEEQTGSSAQPNDELSNLGLDSLDIVEIAMEIEWELNVVMEDEEIEDLFANKKVKDLIEFVEKSSKG